MIIESAFYKLPDYFLTKETPELDYESQLVTYFVLSIFLELQNRGINTPYLNIQLEKKYPKKNYRADIFVKIPWLKYKESLRKKIIAAGYYQIFEKNWIEVKFFGAKERTKSSSQKTMNVWTILNDLLRLKSYIASNEGKYLLIGFNRSPKEYLAFQTKKKKERKYLSQLFQAGEKKIKIDVSQEGKTLGSFEELTRHPSFTLNILTLTIEPKGAYCLPDRPCFWLYLIKILPNLKS